MSQGRAHGAGLGSAGLRGHAGGGRRERQSTFTRSSQASVFMGPCITGHKQLCKGRLGHLHEARRLCHATDRKPPKGGCAA